EIEETEEMVELLVFSLHSEEYAFKISELEEIIRPQQISTLPRTPEYLLGVTSLRGKIIPVVDLKRMLSLTGKDSSTRQKIIILKGDRGPIGVMVDMIAGVVRLPARALTESPPHLDESQSRYIQQVAIFNSRFISIINTEEIMNTM
ncbi:MAG: chemotaxis protein CheW, partial [Thermodesulfovibrionales bacterium]